MDTHIINKLKEVFKKVVFFFPFRLSILVLSGQLHAFVVSNRYLVDFLDHTACQSGASVSSFQALGVISLSQIILQGVNHEGFSDDGVLTSE